MRETETFQIGILVNIQIFNIHTTPKLSSHDNKYVYCIIDTKIETMIDALVSSIRSEQSIE